MDEINALTSTILEYKELLPSPTGQHESHATPEELIEKLSHSHDWTCRGASALVTLANDYGVFMLRNALALAIVIDKEDGELRF
jgi:hypothetical protein